jgi:hypothetical protein
MELPAMALVWRLRSPLTNDHFTDSSQTVFGYAAFDVHIPELTSHIEHDDVLFGSLIGKHCHDFPGVAGALLPFANCK